jgi:hypothetical protein
MRSEIWEYFDKLPSKDSAKCRKCGQIKKSGKSSTKALWDHLNVCSPNAYAQSHPKEKQKKEAQQQKSLQDLGFKKADASLRRQETKEELIAGILLRQNIALSFVEDPGVKQIFAEAYPDLKVSAFLYINCLWPKQICHQSHCWSWMKIAQKKMMRVQFWRSKEFGSI